MEVSLKNRDGQFYHPPPGYALTRGRHDRDLDEEEETVINMADFEPLCRSLTSANFASLQTKQFVLESFMRRLVESTQTMAREEAEQGRSVELDRQRRMKLIRMIQLLMLQRRNLCRQIETLQYNFTCLAQQCSVDRLKGSLDNAVRGRCSMTKKEETHESNLDEEFHDARKDVSIKPKSLPTEKYIESLEQLVKQKTNQLSDSLLAYEQLETQYDKLLSSEAKVHKRSEQLIEENQKLHLRLIQTESGRVEFERLNFELARYKEDYARLSRDHHHLQVLYTSESETRKQLHNQLQEVKGNLRVICRCRPSTNNILDDFKLYFGPGECITIMPHSIQPCPNSPSRNCSSSQSSREDNFCFNKVFSPDASQVDVFDEIRSVISSFVDGYNVCILAYGPTGSGKTYTMQGTLDQPGVVYRAVGELFNLCHPMLSMWTIDLRVSILEIHNEVIYDLLGDKKVRSVKLSDDGNFIRLIDAEEKLVGSEEELLFWMRKGRRRRRVTATKMNVESSRSHHIIRIRLKLTSTEKQSQRDSWLIMCDLAGSESAERIEADGELCVETGFINKSLVTLARVFDALRRRNSRPVFQSVWPTSTSRSTMLRSPSPFTGYVAAPYRDSKLTHLLKPCLGGQAKCVLIITVSGETGKVDRSRKALEFGNQAMRISLGPAKQNEWSLAKCSCRKLQSTTLVNSFVAGGGTGVEQDNDAIG